jgi:CRISPR-associated protein Cas5d
MLALTDVAYNIFAEITLQKEKAKLKSRFGGLRPVDNIRKYQAAFTRRVLKGQCYHRPSLGCRELYAHFAPVEARVVDDSGEPLHSGPLKSYGVGDVGEPLGRMLYDIVFTNDGQRLYAKFFDAIVKQGSLETREDVLRRANRLHEQELEKGETEL